MKEHHHEFEVDRMCNVLQVSRSGYYGWLGRKPSKHQQRDRQLTLRIVELHAQSEHTYGSPRLHEDLKDEGERISRKRVSRIMRENQLFSKHKRKFRHTTDSEHQFPVAENILARSFESDAPNKKWAADITFIPTDEGWLYLAVVIDLFSRRVVGWSMGRRLDRGLVLEALKMALKGRKPTNGLMHHSDQGSQYASNQYRELLEAHAILASMSRRGNCWDNAIVESFFKTLKVERIYHRRYRTRDEAQADIFQYIEVFYNRKRRHSAIGYRTPVDFEVLRMAA
jgi:putative transposase